MSGLDWTEELKKRTGIDFLTTRPMEIEKKSFEIIKGELGEEFVSRYPADALPVLCRVIHTTADFSYRDTLTITEGAIGLAKEVIHRGLPIITDTTMAASGINKTAARKFGIDVHCFIADEDVKEAAKAAHKRLRQVEFRTQAPDHPILWANSANVPESYYLKFFIFQVVDEK